MTLPGKPVPTLDWPGTKNAATHRVFLPKAARQIIEELGTTGFAFVGSRGRGSSASEAMRTICKKLGVEPATPHDLRRTHGTMITRLGFGTDAMNRIENHKEGGISSVYDRHQYGDENARIMEAVAAKIMSLIDGSDADNVIMFEKAK